jgi:signal transduction histidine kinase
MKSIYERVREDYRSIAEEKEIEWVVYIPGNEITVYRDEESVKYRVIPNLLNNAFRLTPRGGRIELGFKTDANEFIGYVCDTGPGMSPDTRGKVFNRGVQGGNSSRGAKGLGLYNVKTVIEFQKGRVWVESEVGHGSTFYFSLPLGLNNSTPR